MTSAVHLGTQFERRCLAAVSQHLGMQMRRVGGKSDGGIDLIGWWPLPHQRLRIIAQCKAEKKKMGPRYVRELEGVLSRQHTTEGIAETATAALLMSSSEFTKEAKLTALSSSRPFCLIHMPTAANSEDDQKMGSVIWNMALARLLGEGVEMRWELGATDGGKPVLWYGGERLRITSEPPTIS